MERDPANGFVCSICGESHLLSLSYSFKYPLALGAISYLEKAVANDSLADTFASIGNSAAPRTKRMLLVCADDAKRDGVVQMLGAPDIDIVSTGTGEEALASVSGRAFDGIVVHLDLEDMPAITLIGRIHASDTGYVASPLPVGEAFAGFAASRLGWSPDPARIFAMFAAG